MHIEITEMIDKLKNSNQSYEVTNYITLLEKENISLEKYLEIKLFLDDYSEEYETDSESIITYLKERTSGLQGEIQELNQDNYYDNVLLKIEKYKHDIDFGKINLHEYLEINDFIWDCENKIDNDEGIKIRDFKRKLNDIIANQTSFLPLLQSRKEGKINIHLDDSGNIVIIYKKNILNLISVGILFLLFFIVVSFIVTQSLFATFLGSLFGCIFILFLMFPLLKNNDKIIDKNSGYFFPKKYLKNIYELIPNFENHINDDGIILYQNNPIYKIDNFHAIQIVKGIDNYFEINIVLNKIYEEESLRFNIYRGKSQERVKNFSQFLKDNLNLPIWDGSEL